MWYALHSYCTESSVCQAECLTALSPGEGMRDVCRGYATPGNGTHMWKAVVQPRDMKHQRCSDRYGKDMPGIDLP